MLRKEGENMKSILSTKVLFYGILLLIPVFIIALFCGYYGLGVLICFGLIFHAAVMTRLFGPKPEKDE